MLRRSSLTLLILLLTASFILGACAQATQAPTQEPLPPTDVPTQPVVAASPTPPPPEPTSTIEIASTPTDAPAAEPLSFTDSLSRTVTLQGPAQRVISLAPGITESLFAVGAGDQMVGRDMFSDYPEAALQIADVGGGFGELNVETIVSLEPDLVLASELTPPEQVEALENLGVTAYYLGNPGDIEGMYANLGIAGQLTGHESEAEQVVSSLKERVAAVEEKIASVEERPLVFYELDSTDPNAPWTPGPGTFISKLISRAGGENLGDVLSSDWAQISIEELLVKDPDLILLGDYTLGGVKPEDVQARESWAGLSAVKEGRVYPVDDNQISRPGPRIVDGLEALAKLLHPELFE